MGWITTSLTLMPSLCQSPSPRSNDRMWGRDLEKSQSNKRRPREICRWNWSLRGINCFKMTCKRLSARAGWMGNKFKSSKTGTWWSKGIFTFASPMSIYRGSQTSHSKRYSNNRRYSTWGSRLEITLKLSNMKRNCWLKSKRERINNIRSIFRSWRNRQSKISCG